MKLQEVIQRIDKSDNNKADFCFEKFASALNLSHYMGWVDLENDNRFKAFWLKSWQCTDRQVGTILYFLDDEFVAISEQTARKANMTFKFTTQELYNKLKNYIEFLLIENEYGDEIELIDMSEDIETTYKIDFAQQVLNYNKFNLGKEFKTAKAFSRSYTDMEKVIVVYDDETTEIVNIRDYDFNCNII